MARIRPANLPDLRSTGDHAYNDAVKPPDPNTETLAARIDALLPQTQCRQCGFDGCRPYAEAVAHGKADINRCPPGGQDIVVEIARLVGVSAKPLDPACGAPSAPAIAAIDEAICIGCTLCIQACPVDAIVGAAKLMHTVIAAECTGCKLCIPPCPVDCIAMTETGENAGPEERRQRAQHFQARYAARTARLARDRVGRPAQRRENTAERRKQATVERVMQRARVRLQRRNG
jgi:H+/Na+-translocating ferredoxin:NAD+ oxidoreductase subunit B